MGLNNTAKREYFRHSAKVCQSKRWKALRFEALRRDGFQCVKCGFRSSRLEVDHIIPVRSAPEKAFDLDALQTLCRSCHSRKTAEEVGLPTPLPPKRQAWRDLLNEVIP